VNIFTYLVQDQIARDIAEALKVKLVPKITSKVFSNRYYIILHRMNEISCSIFKILHKEGYNGLLHRSEKEYLKKPERFAFGQPRHNKVIRSSTADKKRIFL
jgi:chromosome condensin MukBEF MukE localization factor